MPCLLLVLSIALPAYNANSGEPANDEEEALTLGYFPLISTVALFKRFAPLRDYLAESLGRPVILQTAKDFSTFLERSDDRAYDILVTAPHFAVRAV
jgi:phosphonate transport system substrate-binding protein